MAIDLADLREDYTLDEFTEDRASDNPFEQFETWFSAAEAAELPEPNAMVLATSRADGRPAARVVLLKGADADRGFVFYTNYDSRKGRELDAHPHAALVFNWLELQRQIRIEGRVEKLSPRDSADYFHSRPRGSQLGAWASPQSRVIKSREVLEDNLAKMNEKFPEGAAIPKPEDWGGFRVIPEMIEFWQGRSNRLHDRLAYRRPAQNGTWTRERLAP